MRMGPSVDQLLAICCNYAGQGYYVGELIPPAKFDHFRREVGNLSLPPGESVVALLDCTFFGSNKEGVAICTNGVFWNNDTSRPPRGHLSWDEVARGPIVRLRYSDIQVGTMKTISLAGCGFPADNLSLLLMEIQTLLVRAGTGSAALPLHETAPPLHADLPHQWQLAIAGTRCGWYGAGTIRSLISARHVDPAEALVWRPGLADWVPLRSIPELSDVSVSGEAVCPACGYENEPPDKFCGGCGSAIPSIPVTAPTPPPPAPRTSSTTEKSGRVDINSAPIDALLALPHVTLAMATALMGERALRGGFATVEEVGEFLFLQPHEVERLRDRVSFGPYIAPADIVPARPVDLNRASEEQLARLPGIGPVYAKKAVKVRSTKGGFDSLDDFASALELSPHLADRLLDMGTVAPRRPVARPSSGKRIVDY
ncbi:MAG: hypothetical protein NVS4B2_04390 [Chloroflexota bacterium]